MGLINQPSNQIKLTNVSLVRMKKGKKRFEIACYQNKVQDWRSNVEKDIDEVLQIPQVFLNVSKGLVAPNDELQKLFNSTDHQKIAMEILSKGEIQLGEKERQANAQQISNEILQIISTKCINPKSKKRYPPTMIQKLLGELKFNFVSNKSAKIQALDLIRLLTEKQIIPIARAKMKIRIILESKEYKNLSDKLKPLLHIEDGDEDYSGKNYQAVAFIDPVKYRDIVELLKSNKNGHVEVLDMAVIEEGDKNF